MQPSEVFMIAVKFNRVDALRPLLDPFDWSNIPTLTQKDIDRAFVVCCQNNYPDLAQLLLPGTDLAHEHFMGLSWALQKDHMQIVDMIAKKLTAHQFAEVDRHMKWSHNAEKWQQYRLHNTLTQAVAESGAPNNLRKM